MQEFISSQLMMGNNIKNRECIWQGFYCISERVNVTVKWCIWARWQAEGILGVKKGSGGVKRYFTSCLFDTFDSCKPFQNFNKAMLILQQIYPTFYCPHPTPAFQWYVFGKLQILTLRWHLVVSSFFPASLSGSSWNPDVELDVFDIYRNKLKFWGHDPLVSLLLFKKLVIL